MRTYIHTYMRTYPTQEKATEALKNAAAPHLRFFRESGDAWQQVLTTSALKKMFEAKCEELGVRRQVMYACADVFMYV
jgi:hypothetical protein